MALPKEEIIDGMVYDGLWDVFGDYHMGITAENLAEQYNISREQQDEFAYKSQMKTKKAQEDGKFDDQIVPVSISGRKGMTTEFKTDEHPRGDVTLRIT